MNYQITDSGSAIKFITDAGDKCISKLSIDTITILPLGKIKIAVKGSSGDIILCYRDITTPVYPDAVSLAGAVNSMITNCICPPIPDEPDK